MTAPYNPGGRDAESQLGQAHALPHFDVPLLPNSHLDEIHAPLRIAFGFVLPYAITYQPFRRSFLPCCNRRVECLLG